MQQVTALRAWYADNRILAWISLAIAVNQLGFGSIIPVVPLYAKSFDVSQTLIGLTIAVYGLARFLTGVPAARIADGLGRRWTLVIGGLVTVVGNIVCGVAGSYMVFLIGRFVAGIGGALVLTGGQIILADITRPETRGRAMAIYMAVFLFAVGIGPLPGGYLAEVGGLAMPFFVFAGLSAAFTVAVFFQIPETKALGQAAVGAEAQPGFITQIRVLSRNAPFVLISLVSFAMFFARTGGLFNLVPQRAESAIGLNPGQIGLGLAAISLLGLLAAYPAGVLVDRYGRKTVIVPSLAISAVALVLFALATSYAWFLVSCVIWAIASGIAGSAPGAYAADIAPPGMNAAAMGTFRTLADTGYVIGPALLGWAADQYDVNVALYGTAALLGVIGLAFAALAPETYRAARPATEAPSRAPTD